MEIKQFLSIILAFVAALTINVPAFAANPSVTETSTITTAGGTGNSSLMLTVEYPSGTIYGDTFSAIVPAVIPISGVTNSSEATCPTNAKIVNQNVERDIKVSGISMSADGGWSVVDYGTGDFETGKNVSMSFNGDKVGSDGNVALTASNWTIDAGSEKALALDAKISKQEIPMTTTKIATIGFTLSWADSIDSAEDWSDAKDFAITESNREAIGYTEESAMLNIPGYFIGDGNNGTVKDNKYKVVSIKDGAFANCEILKVVNLPSTIISIGNEAFSDCYDLTSITIPNSVTTIGERAFYDCFSLTTLNIPDSVTSIEAYAFFGCEGLTSFTFPKLVTTIKNNTFACCTGLTNMDIPNTITSIEDSAFCDCCGLEEVTIPNTVTSISDRVFMGCESLTVININKETDSISGSPWGAKHAVVKWAN